MASGPPGGYQLLHRKKQKARSPGAESRMRPQGGVFSFPSCLRVIVLDKGGYCHGLPQARGPGHLERREIPNSALEQSSGTWARGVCPKNRDSCGHKVCRHLTSHAGPEAGSPSHGVSGGEAGQCWQWLGLWKNKDPIVTAGSLEGPSRAGSSFPVTLELGGQTEFRVPWSRKVYTKRILTEPVRPQVARPRGPRL